MSQVNKAIAEVGDAIKSFKGEYNERLERLEMGMEQVSDVRSRLDRLSDDPGAMGSHADPALLTNFVQSEGIHAVRSAKTKESGAIELPGTLKQIKSVVSSQSEGTDGGGYPVHPARAGGVFGYGFRRLGLFDIMRTISVESNRLEFARLKSNFSNAADYQAMESQLKAEADPRFDLVALDVATVAQWVRMSRQVMDDDSLLRGELQRVLAHQVQSKVEHELIAGSGGQNRIDGLLNQAVLASSSETYAPDQISEEIAVLEADGFDPDFILVSPELWRSIQRERAANGDDQYLLGSPAAPAPPSLWNLPVIATAAMPAGHWLLGSTAQCAIVDRQQLRAFLSMEGHSNLSQNLVTLLIEWRGAMMVAAPQAFRTSFDKLNPTT